MGGAFNKLLVKEADILHNDMSGQGQKKHAVTHPITCESPMGGREAIGDSTNLNHKQRQKPMHTNRNNKCSARYNATNRINFRDGS